MILLKIKPIIEEDLECADLKLKVDKKEFNPIDDTVNFTVVAPKGKQWTLEISLKIEGKQTQLIKTFDGTGTGKAQLLNWNGITNDGSILNKGKIIASLKSNSQKVDKNLVCEDCDKIENENKPVNAIIKPDIQSLNESFISVLETMKTQLEEQDQQDTLEDGELGTFSVKAVTNEKTILEISQLLEECYKLESAVKDSSTTKVLAKSLSKSVKDKSIKLSKSIAKKALIGLSGGTIGEVISAIGSVYSLTTTTIELCDDIQVGSRVECLKKLEQ